ncbi:MAG: PIG-L deacetylase family protein [Burkholderiales bacterium]|jgi:LmbE family N-acetylglucosaminyl deacetylase
MKTLVIAPHPDDEVLGVGGTLLRRKAEGAELAWLIVTGISKANGWNQEQVERRADEIARVTTMFRFDHVFTLDFPTTQLDRIPVGDLVGAISGVFKAFQPEEVFVPHPSDVHTDHRAVFDAAAACTKWFRYFSVKRVLAYETLSETDFGLGTELGFRPNVFVDIAPYLEGKLKAMDIYASEMAAFPFPRSHEALRALAKVRGVASGYHAAEAFQLLRERS